MAEATIEGKAVGFTHWFRKQKAPSTVHRAGGMQKGGPLPAPKASARGTGLVNLLYHFACKSANIRKNFAELTCLQFATANKTIAVSYLFAND